MRRRTTIRADRPQRDQNTPGPSTRIVQPWSSEGWAGSSEQAAVANTRGKLEELASKGPGMTEAEYSASFCNVVQCIRDNVNWPIKRYHFYEKLDDTVQNHTHLPSFLKERYKSSTTQLLREVSSNIDLGLIKAGEQQPDEAFTGKDCLLVPSSLTPEGKRMLFLKRDLVTRPEGETRAESIHRQGGQEAVDQRTMEEFSNTINSKDNNSLFDKYVACNNVRLDRRTYPDASPSTLHECQDVKTARLLELTEQITDVLNDKDMNLPADLLVPSERYIDPYRLQFLDEKAQRILKTQESFETKNKGAIEHQEPKSEKQEHSTELQLSPQNPTPEVQEHSTGLQPQPQTEASKMQRMIHRSTDLERQPQTATNELQRKDLTIALQPLQPREKQARRPSSRLEQEEQPPFLLFLSIDLSPEKKTRSTVLHNHSFEKNASKSRVQKPGDANEELRVEVGAAREESKSEGLFTEGARNENVQVVNQTNQESNAKDYKEKAIFTKAVDPEDSKVPTASESQSFRAIATTDSTPRVYRSTGMVAGALVLAGMVAVSILIVHFFGGYRNKKNGGTKKNEKPQQDASNEG